MNDNNKTEVERRSILLSELRQFTKNAVSHNSKNKATIKKSLLQFGQYHDLIVLKSNMEVIIGNGTLQSMIELGWESANCLVYDLANEEAVAMALVDNKSSDLHKWDEDILAEVFSLLPEEYYDLTGFDAPDISNLIDQFQDIDLTLPEDDDILPDLVSEEDSRVSPGDLWFLGEHRLLCGDSLAPENLSRLLDGPVDLLHTDPPYNVSYVSRGKIEMTIDNDSMTPEEFKVFLGAALKSASDNMNPGAPFYVWYADIEAVNFRHSCENNGLSIRQGLIWRKNQFVLGRQDYHWIHEPCLYGWKEGASHYWAGGRKQVTVLEHDRPQRNDIHPTMKPVGLIEPLIQNSCPNAGTVLDLFGGSGSTLIACENLNRKARLIELSPVYCHRIIERWEQATGKKATKELTCEEV